MKGIALPYVFAEDLTRTKSDWYYNWSPAIAENCVPMFRNGDMPGFPVDYNNFVILFNEPNNPEPYGHPITPQDAVAIYMKLVEQYPKAKWVVGNVNIYHRRWLLDFMDLCFTNPDCKIPEYIGVHIYLSQDCEVNSLGYLLDGMHAWEFPDTRWWITEFADISGDVAHDEAMVKEFKKRPWIDRWAYFCNRAKGDEPWYPAGWKVQLFDFITGEPTEIGRWYMPKKKIFIPMVNNGIP